MLPTFKFLFVLWAQELCCLHTYFFVAYLFRGLNVCFCYTSFIFIPFEDLKDVLYNIYHNSYPAVGSGMG